MGMNYAWLLVVAVVAASSSAVAAETGALSGLLAAQPGGWIGALSGDGEATVQDAWLRLGDAAFAGMMPGYAFAQSVDLNLAAAGSITGTLKLDGAQGIAVFESGGRTYAAVAAYTDNGVQILDVTDPSAIAVTDSIGDTRGLELNGASGLATFTSGGRTYAAVVASTDNGVQILDMTDPHAVTAAGSITDDADLELDGAQGIAVFESGSSTYAAVAAFDDDGVQILDVTDPHAVTAAGSIDGTFLELDGAWAVATFTSGGSTYAAVAAFDDDGVQILDVTDPHAITAAGSITDDADLELDGADGIAIFESGGSTYATVTAGIDDGVQILDVTDPHSITDTDDIGNTGTLELDGASSIAIFESGSSTYAAVAAYTDDGVQILDVTDPHSITAADDIDGTFLELDGAWAVATFTSGGSTYAAVAAFDGDGVQILDVTDPHAITAADGIDDTETLDLDGAWAVATFTSGTHTYAAVAAVNDDGIQVLNITDPSAIAAAGSITDDADLELDGAWAVATFTSGTHTYAAVAAFDDDGVQILGITDPSAITAAGSITDDADLELDGAQGIAVFESGTHTYAAVASVIDDGVQILDITDPSAITAAGSIDDTRALELDGARGVTTFTSGTHTYAAVAAVNDDGIQVLNITDPSAITAAGSITDTTGLELDGAQGIAVFESGTHTYAAVAAVIDDGVQILDITDPSAITAAGSITDDAYLELDGADSIATFTSGTHTYAAVASVFDDGVQILDVTDPYNITAAGSIDDTPGLELYGASGIATFTSDGRTYATVTAYEDGGVQLLRLTGDDQELAGSDTVIPQPDITDLSNNSPMVASIVRSDPADHATTTANRTLVFAVTFSKNVTGVDAGDFVLSANSTRADDTSEQLTQTNEPAIPISDHSTIQDAISVEQSGTATSVSVAVDISHTYIGDLKIDLIAPDGTTETVHNREGDSTDDIDKTYTPDFAGVSIAGDWTLRVHDGAGGDAGTLNGWTLTIDYGSAANPITSLSGSGDTYQVTVSAAQDGTYNLDLVSSDHGIADESGNPLTDTVPTTGTDETYTVSTVAITDTTTPAISSIERFNPSTATTSSQTLIYEVTFSEDVTGVDVTDFALSSDSTSSSGTGTGQFTQTNSPDIDITEDDSTITDTITVADSGTVTSLSLAVDISHTYKGDLKVDLVAPDGTTKTVHNRSGGSADDIDQTYTPDFAGVSIAGTWTLKMNDNYPTADDGTLNSWTLTINHGSGTGTTNPVTGLSGSGSTYYVTVSAVQDGTYNLDLISSGHGIADESSNPLTNTATTGADETYTVSTVVADTTAPRLSSIERFNPSSATTSSQTLIYEVTFSEDVTGVDTTDFALSSDSTGAANSVTSISGSGSQYFVTVSASTDGTYNLDLISSGHGIEDAAENPLTNTSATGADETYTVSTVVADTTAPRLSSIERFNPSSATTSSQTLIYEVTFSEDVAGVDSADFALSSDSTGGTGTSSGTGQFTQTNSPDIDITEDDSTITDTITVADSGTVTSLSLAVDISHTYKGDLKVDLVAPDGTTKTVHNRSGGSADDIDQTYTPDFAGVSIAGTWTLKMNDNYPTADDGTLNSWTLTINHGSGTGTTNPVTSLSGSGSTYYVTVSAVQDGTYNLDLISSGHGIADESSNPLTNTATTGADETYTVSTVVADTTAPRLSSIERFNPSSATTSSQTLIYEVTFSEDVAGVDTTDFALSSDSTGGTGTSSGTGQFTQTNSPDIDITEDDSTITDTITVADSGTVTSLSLAVDISHTYKGDLKVDLVAPDGTTKTVHNRSGGSADDIDQTYTPDFAGVSIAGTWTLKMNDNYPTADDGTLNSWTLTINHGSGTGTTNPVTSLSGSGSTYYVTVSAVQDGTYNLDLISSGHGIADESSNPLTNTATTGADETYTVSTVVADTTAPRLSSIERFNPSSATTSSQTLIYEVTFSEDVAGVDTTDFALSSDSTGGTGTSSGTGQFTQTNSPDIDITEDDSTITDTITVADSGTVTSLSLAVDISHTYKGDLKVDLVAPDGTTKTVHNRSGGSADDIDQTYTPDFAGVSIAGTWTLKMNDNYPTADDGTLNSWTLTINHGSGTGTTNPVTGLSGSGSTYYVTVSAVQDGTYNLDLISSGHGIEDAAENPLTNTSATGADETYTVSTVVADTTAPRLSSIERFNPSTATTSSQTLVYEVTFSEDVTGVDTTDFALSSDSTGGTGTSSGSNQFTQTNSPDIDITEDNTITDTITVADSGTVTSLSLAVDISHTYKGDLKVDLIAPDGTTRTVHNREGGSADDIDQTYTPDFAGMSITGTWTLRINDNYAALDDGTLNSWTLTINSGSSDTSNPVTSISGSGSQYFVTVSASSDGTYNLDLISSGHGIADIASNPLTNTTPINADHTYTVSTTG